MFWFLCHALMLSVFPWIYIQLQQFVNPLEVVLLLTQRHLSSTKEELTVTASWGQIIMTSWITCGSDECDDDPDTKACSLFSLSNTSKMNTLRGSNLWQFQVTAPSLGTATASLFNFPSVGKLHAERFSPFEWQMKTGCDHFLIITAAEILRVAKYQLDLMAVRREGTRQSEREGQEQGDRKKQWQICEEQIKGTWQRDS